MGQDNSVCVQGRGGGGGGGSQDIKIKGILAKLNFFFHGSEEEEHSPLPYPL